MSYSPLPSRSIEPPAAETCEVLLALQATGSLTDADLAIAADAYARVAGLLSRRADVDLAEARNPAAVAEFFAEADQATREAKRLLAVVMLNPDEQRIDFRRSAVTLAMLPLKQLITAVHRVADAGEKRVRMLRHGLDREWLEHLEGYGVGYADNGESLYEELLTDTGTVADLAEIVAARMQAWLADAAAEASWCASDPTDAPVKWFEEARALETAAATLRRYQALARRGRPMFD